MKNLARKFQRLLGKPFDFEQQIYKALLQKGDVVYDVGASVGGISIYLSRLIGRQGKVIAFEPIWKSYQSLCENISRRLVPGSPIIPIPYGVSNESGVHFIHVPDEDYGMSSIASLEKWSHIQTGAKISSYECSFVSLDAFIASRPLPAPHFIKVDVEGAELLVFKGAEKTLQKRPLMLIEIFAPWEKAFDYTPWDVLNLLGQSGYHFLFACPQGLIAHTPSMAQPFPPEYEQGYNVIAYVPDLHASRIQRLDPLRAGGNAKLLHMPAAPRPNIIVPLEDG